MKHFASIDEARAHHAATVGPTAAGAGARLTGTISEADRERARRQTREQFEAFDRAKREAPACEARARAKVARPKATRAAQGRRARAQGDSDEAAILRAGLAAGLVLRKMPTPTKRIGGAAGAGTFLACYEADAGPDFRGTLPGGRSLVFEAKGSATAALRLTRPNGRPVLTEAQRRELAEVHAAGGVAGVLVHVEPAAGACWLWMPWPAWCDAVDVAETEGRASLSIGAMVAAGGVECDGVTRWPWALAGEAAHALGRVAVGLGT